MADEEPLELRPMVKAMAQAMERKLRENDHKGGWARDSPDALLYRLSEESGELRRAVMTHGYFVRTRPGEPLEAAIKLVVDEAADVCNFAAMVADVVGGLK